MEKLLFITMGLLAAIGLQAQNTLNNAGVIKMHAGSAMGIFGDFINSGTFNQTAGAVTFAGASAQAVSGTTPPALYDLVVNNTSATGVTLSSGLVTVANSAVFTDGYLYTTSTNLLHLLDNATVSGASNASFVEGPVSKTGNDAFIFPTGKSANYQPAAITAPLFVADQFTAEYFRANPTVVFGPTPGTGVDHVSLCEYWNLARPTGASNVGLTLGWNASSCGVTSLADLRIVRWSGSSWTDYGNGGTTGNTSAGTISSALPSAPFGPFTLGSSSLQNPLPVGLLEFNATANGNYVDLDWKTASEAGNASFTIEKTKDGQTYEWVATVAGAGVSTQMRSYATIDKMPYAGLSYYRLAQTDFDGNVSHSELRSVTFGQQITDGLAFRVYPNPNAGDQVNLQFGDGFTKQLQLEITDFAGRCNHEEQLTIGKSGEVYVIDPAQPLQPGIYTVTVTSGHQRQSQRFAVY